jgi:hypothetical protein
VQLPSHEHHSLSRFIEHRKIVIALRRREIEKRGREGRGEIEWERRRRGGNMKKKERKKERKKVRKGREGKYK